MQSLNEAFDVLLFAFVLGQLLIYKKENDGANFYGKTTGINDVRLSCTYKLKIGNHPLPITSQAMWNPEANKGYFRVAVNLLDL